MKPRPPVDMPNSQEEPPHRAAGPVVVAHLAAPSPSRWLSLARLLVLAYCLIRVASLLWSLPAFYERGRHLKPGTVAASAFYGWTVPQMESAAAELGLRPEVAGGALFAASLLCLVCFLGIGGLLFWRRSDTWVGLLTAYIMFATGPGFSGLLLSEAQLPAWEKSLYSLAAVVTWPTFFLMLYLFPNGRFAPRSTRYVAFCPICSSWRPVCFRPVLQWNRSPCGSCSVMASAG